MIDKLYGVPRKLKDSGKPYKMAFKINKFLAVTLVPFFSLFNKRKGTDENSDVIISLTTYPARINIVWVTIATLLNQKIKPKRVCLYLAKEQFPNGEEELPKKLTSLKKRGLEILFCDDLKSHKKYYYAIKDNPENIIITADDDMLYPESMTKELLDAHSQYPDTVICEYAHKITILENGEIEEYNKWQAYGEDTKPTMGILPVGCGGVLYPPHVLDERIFDKEKIKELCPVTDDLWLKTMEMLKGTKAAICKKGSLIYFDMVGTRKSGLQHVNCGQNQNDVAIKKLLEEYPDINSLINDEQ